MKTLTVVLAIALAVPAHARDHSADYQVGTFTSTDVASDGSFSNCTGGGCASYNAGHNVHYIQTVSGVYYIEAPVSTGKMLLVAMLSNGPTPDIHISWFMDDLHNGDKVLFYAKCNKHNRCVFWLPKPDQPSKEYITQGEFHPSAAKSNTAQL